MERERVIRGREEREREWRVGGSSPPRHGRALLGHGLARFWPRLERPGRPRQPPEKGVARGHPKEGEES